MVANSHHRFIGVNVNNLIPISSVIDSQQSGLSIHGWSMEDAGIKRSTSSLC